ncbi:hypothetical protein [Neosynechococcus sphagnicola]|uniref:hypothetical protein n=1 Tax=Neosynechococcus sphagnicola TaxID=1501145 RepID=UPI0019552CBE|nr:hypothetical protein [Neosynechococcus sphagnicola]
MKSFVRWGATLGLIGGALLGPSLTPVVMERTQVLALTEAEIITKLKPIPVFTLTNAEGAPLVATPPEFPQPSTCSWSLHQPAGCQSLLGDAENSEP